MIGNISETDKKKKIEDLIENLKLRKIFRLSDRVLWFVLHCINLSVSS